MVGAAALVLLGKNLADDDQTVAADRAPAPATRGTITGSLTLVDDITNRSIARGDFCTGLDGYGDIEAGAQVTVKNEEGHILGIGNLRPGAIVEVDQEAERYRCQFRFTVADVGKARFYSVEVGRRGAITHSRDELELSGWTVDLTLGE